MLESVSPIFHKEAFLYFVVILLFFFYLSYSEPRSSRTSFEVVWF